MHESETVGWIGLGNAGWNMAKGVAAGGYRMVVGDADKERESRFAAEFENATSAAEAGWDDVSILILSLPNGFIVREVLIDEGLAASLAPGTIVVDMSSSAPAGTVELVKEIEALGLPFLDAPVSMPTPDGAWSRGLTIMAGCDDPELFARVKPVLDTMSLNVFHVGPVAAGHAVKTLNNFISSAAFVATLDALTAGADYGVDPGIMIEVWNLSTARNFATVNPLRQDALTRRFKTGFQVGLFLKDLRIAKDLMDQLETDSTLAEFLAERMQEVQDQLGYDADCSESIKVWEQKWGVTIPEVHAPAPPMPPFVSTR